MRRKTQVSRALALLILTLLSSEAPFTHAVVWTAPSMLQTPTTFIDYVPSITSDAQGRLWVFWQGERIYPTIREDIYYKIRYGPDSWSNDTKLTNDAAQDITPAALGLPDGTMFVVWASKRSTNYDLYSVTIANGVRGVENQITTGPTDNWGPAVVLGNDNRIWLFWNKAVNNSFDIYYRVYDGMSWTSEQALTTDPDVDLTPTGVASRDGKIWVAWASYRTEKYEVFVKTYDGSAWSSDIQLTNSANDNESPALLQDSGGVIWVFWNRVLNAPAGSFQTDIYYKTSGDNGVSWSAETPLTSTTEYSENDPSAVQGTDGLLWIIYSSNLAGQGTYDLFYMTSDQILVHDVAVESLLVSPQKVRYNSSVLIEVTIANVGDFSETPELTVYLNSTIIFSQIASLGPNEVTTVLFSYTTLETIPGRYVLTASLTPVPGETSVNQVDNSLSEAGLHLLPPGDLDQDGDVDILDAGAVILAIDSGPGSPNWNQNADVDNDADVDLRDVSITLLWFDTVT